MATAARTSSHRSSRCRREHSEQRVLPPTSRPGSRSSPAFAPVIDAPAPDRAARLARRCCTAAACSRPGRRRGRRSMANEPSKAAGCPTGSFAKARPARQDGKRQRRDHGRYAGTDDGRCGAAAAARPADLRGADARAAARLARPDDRLDRAADDRRRSRRSQPPLLGRDRHTCSPRPCPGRSTASSATSTDARRCSRARSCSSWSARRSAGSART